MRTSRGPMRGRGQGAITRSNTRLRGPSTNARRGRRGNDLIFTNDHDRRMEDIASVSRSGGLEKDGDLLKERSVQEEFRMFIDKKVRRPQTSDDSDDGDSADQLRAFWDLHETGSSTNSQTVPVQKYKDNQENILILFRKLREGLFASNRKDSFALEVYETSLYLSVIFDSPVQTTAILSHLLPDMYPSISVPSLLATVLILLLHQLVISFPSQQGYMDQMKRLVPNLLERPSAAYKWISSLAQSLRTSNFVHFDKVSRPDAFQHLVPILRPTPSEIMTVGTLHDLPRMAVNALVSRLRMKAREEAWVVLRNAYRELSSSDETQTWLGKRLFFDSFNSEASMVRFDDWVQEKCRDGHLRPKEGIEGRWMVCKAK